MMPFPSNVQDFQREFSTEASCEAYLVQLRWPRGFVCPNCSHDGGYELERRRLIQCAVCRHQTSVTAGTIFHKTRLPLTCWFWMIYQIAQDKGGASATRLASQLGRPYKTIWHVLHKLRSAMGSRDREIQLAGLIEMDEAMLGPQARRPAKVEPKEHWELPQKTLGNKPYGRIPSDGRKRKTITEVMVLVEAERFHAGNVVLRHLPSKSYDSIREIIEQTVEPGQWFRTDAHHTHWVLRQLASNFSVHKSSEAEGCEALPVVHRVISLLKHFLMGTYHGVSVKYLPGYLQEFSFRFMRREKGAALTQSLLRACVFAKETSYAELRL